MKIVLPQLGEGIDRAEVAFWHVKVGDAVGPHTDLVEMVTDKATFIIPADCAGVVKNVYARVGESVLVGAPLAQIELVE
ncbi:MAG TPA: lipoyl domain-containing protein [Candidatus Omnitrophota bacterium]|jgi:pyruvate/2-oxoglutarate dehydrogenase complex dihydrolipoamide acyltransferase (E2) component|nr:lipoyl domain-containing protein [Candidatus Omnitrophota bacterium]HPN56439.1 lipoyl domain-containing protein [Candidatus Omnitrophota bacterium]